MARASNIYVLLEGFTDSTIHCAFTVKYEMERYIARNELSGVLYRVRDGVHQEPTKSIYIGSSINGEIRWAK